MACALFPTSTGAGLPLLIVEVLSLSTAARDRSVKAKCHAELAPRHLENREI